jgi:hypothetical protein
MDEESVPIGECYRNLTSVSWMPTTREESIGAMKEAVELLSVSWTFSGDEAKPGEETSDNG